MGLSVVICAHDPRADHLERVLAALRAQALPRQHWELLLVDNGSRDALAPRVDLAWHPRARHVREDRLGLAWARARGIAESREPLLVFVDDDNVLARDYLERAEALGREWPMLGAWGGSILPEYEQQPEERVQPFCSYLAVRAVDDAHWSNVPGCLEATPWGAGMCVRREVAQAYAGSLESDTLPITGRRGELLLSGDDVEIAMTACKLGFGMGVFPSLVLTHLIAKRRIDENYLVKIAEGIRTSTLLVDYKWRGIAPPSPFGPVALLRMLKNVAVRRGLDRRMYLAGVRSLINARRMIRDAR